MVAAGWHEYKIEIRTDKRTPHTFEHVHLPLITNLPDLMINICRTKTSHHSDPNNDKGQLLAFNKRVRIGSEIKQRRNTKRTKNPLKCKLSWMHNNTNPGASTNRILTKRNEMLFFLLLLLFFFFCLRANELPFMNILAFWFNITKGHSKSCLGLKGNYKEINTSLLYVCLYKNKMND